jgi:hypothetical protein
MRLALNLCAAAHAWFAFAIVDLPEIFERFAIRETFGMLEVHAQSRSVGQGVAQDFANCLM